MNTGKMVSEELSGSIAKSFVSMISNYHRIQASSMYHDAALRVVDELRRMGLSDANILQFTADGKKRYWAHRSTLGWTVKSAELRMLKPKEELLANFEQIPASLHTYSQGTPSEGVLAELVDVGAGISPKDYKGKKVKGKIVLARGGAQTVHHEAVVKRGAAGVITDTFAFEFPKVRETIDVPDAHCYQGIWPTSDDAKRIRFGFSLSKRQGDELRRYLSKGKKVVLRAKVDARLFPGKYEVVTATIRGSSKPDEEVFLIAHLCHSKPGANDNASGSGLLMEIARTVSSLVKSGRIKRPARTIRFIWVPETTGTVAFLSTRQDIWKRFIAGVNLDMVGEDQELCKSTLNIGLTPDALPSYLNDLVVSMMEESAKELDHMAKIGLVSTFRFNRGAFSAGSDHAEFVEQTVGVPCVSLTQWPDKFYHTSMDTIDKVSEESLRRVGWGSAMVMLRLANADSRTAHELANLTYSRGLARIAESSGRASEEIFRMAKDAKVKDKAQGLARLGQRHTNRIQHIVKREQESVRSVLMLGTDNDLNESVASHVRDLADAGRRETDRLGKTLSAVARSHEVRCPGNVRETKAERESKKIVPKKRFKGTIPWSDYARLLGEKRLDEYKKIEESDPDFMSKTAELVNLIDGRRSAYEITVMLSGEYGPTDSAHVVAHLRDLERLNLVSM